MNKMPFSLVLQWRRWRIEIRVTRRSASGAGRWVQEHPSTSSHHYSAASVLFQRKVYRRSRSMATSGTSAGGIG